MPPLNPIGRELFSTEPQVFADSIDRFIQHGSTPAGPSPALKMPAFGDSHTLTQQEVSNIEAYTMRLNRIDRALLENPGLSPDRFFLLTMAVFGLAGLGLGAGWVRLRMRARSNT